jgi:hypothetical protein
MPAADILPADETRCIVCHATLSQMESDLAALPSLRGQVIARMQEVTAPEEHLVRVRAADFFTVALNAPDVVDEAVERLSVGLHKCVAEGATVIVE